jgi:hypothetical protein
MLEYAAWRLAKVNLDNVTSWAWIMYESESFLISSFLQNYKLLSCSRRLIVTIFPGILAAVSMGELKLVDLIVLSDALLTSWYEVELRGLEVESIDLQLWVALEART